MNRIAAEVRAIAKEAYIYTLPVKGSGRLGQVGRTAARTHRVGCAWRR